MIRYGAVLPDRDSGEIRFFRTSRPVESGAYLAPLDGAAGVEIAESTAALLMAIYPAIDRIQRRARDDLGSPGLEKGAAERLAEEMTDNLARRLAEDDGIWEDEPSWLDQIRRVETPRTE